MGWNRKIAGWMAVSVVVIVAMLCLRNAAHGVAMPTGDVEPLAVSADAFRLAGMRQAGADWSRVLDRIVAGLQEQAVVERADARQSAGVQRRARMLGLERDRLMAEAARLGSGPIGAPAGAAAYERFTASLRRSIETTPEAPADSVDRLRLALDGGPTRIATASAAAPLSGRR